MVKEVAVDVVTSSTVNEPNCGRSGSFSLPSLLLLLLSLLVASLPLDASPSMASPELPPAPPPPPPRIRRGDVFGTIVLLGGRLSGEPSEFLDHVGLSCLGDCGVGFETARGVPREGVAVGVMVEASPVAPGPGPGLWPRLLLDPRFLPGPGLLLSLPVFEGLLHRDPTAGPGGPSLVPVIGEMGEDVGAHGGVAESAAVPAPTPSAMVCVERVVPSAILGAAGAVDTAATLLFVLVVAAMWAGKVGQAEAQGPISNLARPPASNGKGFSMLLRRDIVAGVLEGDGCGDSKVAPADEFRGV
mmetsp:Transcript_96024/g.210128  ORF Transcript_96024/g.210128 Transcript_96024/m.210128 type:complete len:301 (-) Transcript_96024:817-1719(-)